MVIATVTNPKKRAIVIQFKSLCSKDPDNFRKAINTRLKKIENAEQKVEYITKMDAFINNDPLLKTTVKAAEHFSAPEMKDLITYISKVKLIVEQEYVASLDRTENIDEEQD